MGPKAWRAQGKSVGKRGSFGRSLVAAGVREMMAEDKAADKAAAKAKENADVNKIPLPDVKDATLAKKAAPTKKAVPTKKTPSVATKKVPPVAPKKVLPVAPEDKCGIWDENEKGDKTCGTCSNDLCENCVDKIKSSVNNL